MLDSFASIMPSLFDLYVVQESGVCVYHKKLAENNELNADEMIVSGFLSAIDAFSSNIETRVHKLALEDFQFIYYRNNDLIYIVRAKNEVDDDFMVNCLQSVSAEFYETYKHSKGFNGDVHVFQTIGELFLNNLRRTRNEISLHSHFEITGKRADNLTPHEAKIYSFLRLKGRNDLLTISKKMQIPEKQSIKLAKRLVEQDLLVVYT